MGLEEGNVIEGSVTVDELEKENLEGKIFTIVKSDAYGTAAVTDGDTSEYYFTTGAEYRKLKSNSMKLLLIILLFISASACAQNDSINVKITKIIIKDSITHVWMQGAKRAKYYTACKCKVPYKEKDVIRIRRPEVGKTESPEEN